MVVKVKCPKCEKPLSLKARQVNSLFRCRFCSHLFVPVHDPGVPCPRCGSVIVAPSGEVMPRVTCLSCGLVLRKRRRTRTWFVAVIAVAAVAFFAVLIAAHLVTTPSRYRMLRNQTWAKNAVRMVVEAQKVYDNRHGVYGTLDELYSEGLITPRVASATSPQTARNGYYLTLEVEYGDTWTIEAKPAEEGVTGTASYYADSSGMSIIMDGPIEPQK